MSWGKIYETTYWGLPSENGWGAEYYDYVDPTPFNELLTEIGEYVMTEQNENIIVQ